MICVKSLDLIPFKSVFRFRRGKNLSLLKRWVKALLQLACALVPQLVASELCFFWAAFHVWCIRWSCEFVCWELDRSWAVTAVTPTLLRDQFGWELSWDLTPAVTVMQVFSPNQQTETLRGCSQKCTLSERSDWVKPIFKLDSPG